MANKPARQLRNGALQLTAWANDKGWSWQIRKSYKDQKTDEWKESKYFFMSDLKKLKDLIQDAIDGGEDEGSDEEERPTKGKVSFDNDDIPF